MARMLSYLMGISYWRPVRLSVIVSESRRAPGGVALFSSVAALAGFISLPFQAVTEIRTTQPNGSNVHQNPQGADIFMPPLGCLIYFVTRFHGNRSLCRQNRQPPISEFIVFEGLTSVRVPVFLSLV